MNEDRVDGVDNWYFSGMTRRTVPERGIVRLLLKQLLERGRQIAEANQVAVLVIADAPRRPVIDLHSVGQLVRLREINHPHIRLAVVVNEQ